MTFFEAAGPSIVGLPGAIVAGVFGALWGSFFNVIIVRLPAEESAVKPASHCRHCKAPIKWYDNIPILSYVFLLGRCRHCKTGYSPRYLMVEVIVCAATVAVHQVYLAHGDGPLGLRVAQFFIVMQFIGWLVAIAFIDIDTMLILNVITYPAIPLCIGLSYFMDLPHWWDGLVGAAIGYAFIRFVLADGWEKLTGRQGMGYGDAKLLAMIGGLLGWQVLPLTMALAAFQGSFIGLPMLILARRRGQAPTEAETGNEGEAAEAEDVPLRYAAMPFGPFLSLAGIEMALAGKPIQSAVEQFSIWLNTMIMGS